MTNLFSSFIIINFHFLLYLLAPEKLNDIWKEEPNLDSWEYQRGRFRASLPPSLPPCPQSHASGVDANRNPSFRAYLCTLHVKVSGDYSVSGGEMMTCHCWKIHGGVKASSPQSVEENSKLELEYFGNIWEFWTFFCRNDKPPRVNCGTPREIRDN